MRSANTRNNITSRRLQPTIRVADKGAIGKQIAEWQQHLEQKWTTLHFGEMKIETRGEQHLFEIQVYLNDLDPEVVRVELYADGVAGSAPVRLEMKRVSQPADISSGNYLYSATVSAARLPTDYTARLIIFMQGSSSSLGRRL